MAGLSKEDWWIKMTHKYGSEDAVREAMQGFRAKATPTRMGGFAYMKANGQLDKLKEISKKGGSHGNEKKPTQTENDTKEA